MSLLSFFRELLEQHNPHPLLLENRRRFTNFNQNKPLTEYSFVVLDTELTGLSYKDEIISIGAVKISNMQIEMGTVFHSLVRPLNLKHNQATFIHQITPDQLRAARPLRDVLPEFVEFCGDSLLVGHFLEIDLGYLNRATKKVLGGTLANPTIDTLRLVKAYKETSYVCEHGYCDQSFPCNLNELAEEYKLPRFKAHNALEDALQCAYLFLFLAKKLNNGQVKTLLQLHNVGRPLLLRQN